MPLFQPPVANPPQQLQQQPQPNFFDRLGPGLAQILTVMEQQRQAKLRQQELTQQGQYQQGQLSLQSREQFRLESAASLQLAQNAQVGSAIRAALGGAPSVPSSGQPTMPMQQAGNATQSMGPGLMPGEWNRGQIPGVNPDQMPPAFPMFGNGTQGQLGSQWQGQEQATGQGQGLFHQTFASAAQALSPQQGAQATPGEPTVFGGTPGLAGAFRGVADQYLPDAVKAVRDVQQLSATTLPDPSGNIKDFEYMKRLAEHDPQAAGAFWELIRGRGTTINNLPGPQGETEYSKKVAESLAGVRADKTKAADVAYQSMPRLAAAYDLAGPMISGVGATYELGMARVLSKMGVKPAKDLVANTQTFLKLTGEGSLDYLRDRVLGSGTAVSDSDREFVQRLSAGDITLDATSIKRMLRINAGVGLMKMQDAADTLRDQAHSYPANATQNYAEAAQIERKLHSVQTQYAKMLKAEGATADLITKITGVPAQ